jgi:hypothetical protein
MRNGAVRPAHQSPRSRAASRLAAICLAGMGLTACGQTADKAEGQPATSAGTSSASAAGSVAVYQALADAAPPELRADAELLLTTYQEDREEIAQAGWKPLAVVNTLADDLQDDNYVDAAGHQMTYLLDVCHIDPTKPKGAVSRP